MNFAINLFGCALAEIAMLRNLATQEDLLFLLAEGDRTEARHAELADHLASKLGRLLNVVPGPRGHGVKENLYRAPATHHDGESGFEIVTGVSVLVVER